MIIASKGNVRLEGKGSDILSEFATIAASLLDFKGVTPDILKSIIDITIFEKENAENDNTRD